jgi:lysophospholipase L1-like esterase
MPVVGSGGGGGGIPNQTFAIFGEFDSIGFGLGGQPAFPFTALGALPGASVNVIVPTPGFTAVTTPVTGVGTVTLTNGGTSGISIITADQNFATRGGAFYDATKNINILTIMLGTNTSGASDTSAEQKYFLLRDYIRQWKALNPTNRVVIGTLIARDDDGGTFFNTVMIPLNNYIRTLYNSDLRADFLVDFGNDSRFNSLAGCSNTSFYTTDLLHPDVNGELVMGTDILAAPLLSVLQGAGTQIIAPTLTFAPFETGGLGVLSNGNKTLTGDQCGVIPSFKSGKRHWEFFVNAMPANGALGLYNDLFVNPGQALFQTNSFAYGSATGTAMNGSGLPTNPGNWTANDSVIFECDYSNPSQVLLFMGFVRAGAFSGYNGTSANPATRTGGVDITAITNGTGFLRPAANISGSAGCIVTTQLSAATFVQPPTTGFSAFGP